MLTKNKVKMKFGSFQITDGDISKGKPKDHRYCPIAIAIKRIYSEEPPEKGVTSPSPIVRPKTILMEWPDQKKGWFHYDTLKLPKYARDFIYRFDHKKR